VTSSRREFIGKSLALAVFPKDSSLKIGSSATASEQFWYARAAERWFEALPLGNGHLGAMVFGGVTQERLALSECTAWSGAPGTLDVSESALSHLAHIRELLFKGNVEVRALCEKHLLAHPRSFGTNLPLPELNLDFEDKSEATDYRRTLDLDQAIARVTYRRGTCRFTREVIASHPHHLLAIRLTCNRAKQLSFKVSFAGLTLPATIATEDNDKLVLRGHAYERMHSNGHDGVKLQIRAQVLPTGGSISASGQQLHVQNADAVIILLGIATDFSGVNPAEACRARIDRANKLTYAEIRRAISFQVQANHPTPISTGSFLNT
jgi:alpha-L-fucosidase 2